MGKAADEDDDAIAPDAPNAALAQSLARGVGEPHPYVLVVLSIAVGVFSVGVVRGTQDLLTQEMDRNWQRTLAASARLTLSPFGYDFVESVRRMPEIDDAEGRKLALRARVIQSRCAADSVAWHRQV